MAIAVSNADRHQCDTWPYRVEELRAAARRATVMTDLEHVRPERIAIACNKPVLLGSFRITDEEKTHNPNANEDDRTREIGIGEPCRPSRIRPEKANSDAIDDERISGMDTLPCRPCLTSTNERLSIGVGAASEGGVKIVRWMKRRDYG